MTLSIFAIFCIVAVSYIAGFATAMSMYHKGC